MLSIAYAKKNAQVGGPLDDGLTHGPQVSRARSDKVLAYMEQATRGGAKAVMGGHKVDRQGYFIEPTVFVNANEKSTIVREEVFGPVVSSILRHTHTANC